MRHGMLDNGAEVVSPVDFVESVSKNWLDGFWDPRHSIPSPPILIEGDAARYLDDLDAARSRARKRLQYYSGNRWQIIEEWPEADFMAEEVYAI